MGDKLRGESPHDIKFDPSQIEVAAYLIMVAFGVLFFLNRSVFMETAEHPVIALGRGALAILLYSLLMTVVLYAVVRLRIEVQARV